MSATARHAHDDEVLEALHGPSSADARESLVYWRRRLDTLPRRRRTARREARAMVLAWEERVRDAELHRWGGGLMGRAAGSLAVALTLRPGALARRLVPRWLVVGVLTLTLGAAVLAGAVVGALVTLLL